MSERGVAAALMRDLLHSEVTHLRELGDTRARVLAEQLRTVELRFELIERQRVELKVDNQKSLDTALAGAQSDLQNLARTYTTGHAALTAALDEIKGRVTIVEAKATGGKEVSATVYVIMGLMLSLAMLAATTLHLWVH